MKQKLNKAFIPEKMKAVLIEEHGGPEVLNIKEVPVPRVGQGEVLIKVKATALNHLDIFVREGLKGPGVPKITLPHISGVDIVGQVVQYGHTEHKEEQNKRPAIGKRVLLNSAFGCGTCRYCRQGEPSMCHDYKIIGEHLWGGFAEYVVAPAKNIIEIPNHIPSVQAASIPAVYTTAWRAVVTVGHIKPSDRVLIVGASGGLGSAQLQIAVRAGAEVIAIAGSEEKRKKAQELGAVAVFDSHGNWREEVMEWTQNEGVQLAFDAVGKPTFRDSLNCLDMGGKLILSGATAGDFPEISIREIYQHHRQVLGAPMGNWEDFLQVTNLIWRGEIKPIVYKKYSFEDIAEAQNALEKRQHFGKIVIEIDPDLC
ncbi:zinc-binding dehydrogenase [Virgibacillus byunsanensis]|uniref:Zinc-binding dehydrogenase n=1 Tax=Virgibacillus byunsanensis TaxID=570945 RepID=A0ABW3LNC6_9BACI